MTESDLNTDRLQVAAEGKRPWGTPRVIESEVASRTRIVHASSTPFPDSHPPGPTITNGS
jgi:hypothetical protein